MVKNMPEIYPISTLGDGTYVGKMSGYIFVYNGIHYRTTEFGVRGFDQSVGIIIENGIERKIW